MKAARRSLGETSGAVREHPGNGRIKCFHDSRNDRRTVTRHVECIIDIN